jgi:hypothetical protein
MAGCTAVAIMMLLSLFDCCQSLVVMCGSSGKQVLMPVGVVLQTVDG